MTVLAVAETPLAGCLDRLRAAAEPTRLRLLALCSMGEWTVSDLVQVVGQSQPRVSRHLKVLAEAGLLERFREGSWVFYRLIDRSGDDVAARLVALLPASPELELDRRRLEDVRAKRRRRAQTYFDGQAWAWERVRALTVADEEVDAALQTLVATTSVSRLIDIGTGTGHVLRTLSADVDAGLGIDLSLDMLHVARANLEDAGVVNCQVRHGDMYHLPVEDSFFDCAVLHQVLHFAEDPASVVREAARVLRPGGHLVVVDLAAHDVEALRRDFAHRRLGFSDHELVDWFARAGLASGDVIRLPGPVAATMIWDAWRLAPEGAPLPDGSLVR